jgi:hypothetical protein
MPCFGRNRRDIGSGPEDVSYSNTTRQRVTVPFACQIGRRSAVNMGNSRSLEMITRVAFSPRDCWPADLPQAEGVGFEPTRTLPRPSGFQDGRPASRAALTAPEIVGLRRLRIASSGVTCPLRAPCVPLPPAAYVHSCPCTSCGVHGRRVSPRSIRRPWRQGAHTYLGRPHDHGRRAMCGGDANPSRNGCRARRERTIGRRDPCRVSAVDCCRRAGVPRVRRTCCG